MAKRKKKKRPAAPPEAKPAGWQPFYWMIGVLCDKECSYHKS
jgi:hypothetical protein